MIVFPENGRVDVGATPVIMSSAWRRPRELTRKPVRCGRTVWTDVDRIESGKVFPTRRRGGRPFVPEMLPDELVYSYPARYGTARPDRETMSQHLIGRPAADYNRTIPLSVKG